VLRIFAGLAIIAGQVCFGWNLYKTWLQQSGVGGQESGTSGAEVSS
jgi:hypothetical protein